MFSTAESLNKKKIQNYLKNLFFFSLVIGLGPRKLYDRKEAEFTDNQYLLSQKLI